MGILQSHIKDNHKMLENNAHIFHLLCVYFHCTTWETCLLQHCQILIFLSFFYNKAKKFVQPRVSQRYGHILGPPIIMCDMLATQYNFFLYGKKLIPVLKWQL